MHCVNHQIKTWNRLKSGLYFILLLVSSVLPLQAQLPGRPAQTTAAPLAAEASIVSVVSSAYVLQPSDAIQVSVFNEPDLSVTVRLNGDGTVMIPLLGRLTLANLNLQQVQDLITQKLGADYLVNPQVMVAVVDHVKRYFTLLGQVSHPGPYEIPPEGKVTFMQAIGMGGGFTRIANTGHVTVKRVIGNKRYKIFTVNANKLGHGDSEDFEIQVGDMITVPESWF